MSDLVIVAFPDEAAAFAARAELVKLQKEYLIEMEDAVVITHSADGAVKLHQPINLTGAGAVSGTLWGGLVGLIFLNPLLGAAIGAGAGALSGSLTDIGIDDKFLKQVGESVDKGGSALAVLIRKMTADKVMEKMGPFLEGGRVLQTSLTAEQEERLKSALQPAAPQA